MSGATDRRVLDELLSHRRIAGVEGCEIVLTTPAQDAAARVRGMAMAHGEMEVDAAKRAAPRGKRKRPEPDMDAYRAMYASASALAVAAVAATLIVGDEVHPSGDEVQAGRLVARATGAGMDVLGTDLAVKAMELCGLSPVAKEGDAAGEGGDADPPA